MNTTTQFLIGFIGIIMIGYLFVAVFQCKSVNNFVDTEPTNNTEESGNNTEESGNNTGELGNNTEESGNNTGELGNNTGELGNNIGTPANNNGISANNTEESTPQPTENNSFNKSSSNNNLQGSPTDAKEDIMFSEKQVTSIFKTQFNYGNLIYFSN